MSDLHVIRFHRKGAHYQTTAVEVPEFLQPPVEVTKDHNKPGAKAKTVRKPAHDVVTHQGQQYLLLNKGHKYQVTLENADGKTAGLTLNAKKRHVAVAVANDARVASVDAEQEES